MMYVVVVGAPFFKVEPPFFFRINQGQWAIHRGKKVERVSISTIHGVGKKKKSNQGIFVWYLVSGIVRQRIAVKICTACRKTWQKIKAKPAKTESSRRSSHLS